MLKRGALGDLTAASFDHFVQAIRFGLNKIHCQAGLMKAASREQGSPWNQTEHPADTMN